MAYITYNGSRGQIYGKYSDEISGVNRVQEELHEEITERRYLLEGPKYAYGQDYWQERSDEEREEEIGYWVKAQKEAGEAGLAEAETELQGLQIAMRSTESAIKGIVQNHFHQGGKWYK